MEKLKSSINNELLKPQVKEEKEDVALFAFSFKDKVQKLKDLTQTLEKYHTLAA